jgi:hypothetical protein
MRIYTKNTATRSDFPVNRSFVAYGPAQAGNRTKFFQLFLGREVRLTGAKPQAEVRR